ncbi:MAG TPA: LLM class flavin-dependent oxidoreductase, partial [bacterium]|nr:LLM class flavin-dependent oxidoreductase [bacterium]
VYSRTPAVLASTALALSHLAGERFILGLGASSHLMVEGWHGLKLEKPLTRMRETTLLLRMMLAGEKAEFDGETLHSHGFRLLQPAKAPVPIYLAGLRPKMLELAGELGDGVVVNLFPSKALPKMLEHVAVGGARSGKTRGDLDIVCRHQVLVTDNPAQARDRFRQRFAPYYATPVYNRFLAWAGYPEVAAAIEQGWQAKDRARTTGALSDALVDELAIIGSADECRARILALARTGITTPIIHPLTTDPAEMRRTLEAFAPERFVVT